MVSRPPLRPGTPTLNERLRALMGTTMLVVASGVVAALALGALITVVALILFDSLA